MGNRGVASLLEELRSATSRDSAWMEFLETYSAVLYQIARACTSDNDSAADCYLHICERLARNGCQRLLKFNPAGAASFTTWLRVVARNLCFDWHRSQRGRPRPFKSLQHLSALELEIYNSRFVRGSSQQETLHRLEARFPGTDLAELSEIEERLQASLNSRQHWILANRKQADYGSSIAIAGEEEDSGIVEVADPTPNQEVRLADEERRSRLLRSLELLSAAERLLLQLRFEQELSLEEIARLCGFQDAQRVHRTLGIVLKKLRHTMK